MLDTHSGRTAVDATFVQPGDRRIKNTVADQQPATPSHGTLAGSQSTRKSSFRSDDNSQGSRGSKSSSQGSKVTFGPDHVRVISPRRPSVRADDHTTQSSTGETESTVATSNLTPNRETDAGKRTQTQIELYEKLMGPVGSDDDSSLPSFTFSPIQGR